MKQTSLLTRQLADAQEKHAERKRERGRYVYRVYTEYYENLLVLALRHLGAFTLFPPSYGGWKGKVEAAGVIEYIGSESDLDTIRELARDIKRVNEQSSVLITSAAINLEEV